MLVIAFAELNMK